MPNPTFDRSNGWWFLRWRDEKGKRFKQPLARDPRWKGKGHRIAKPPPDVVLIARKYQDLEAQARHGVDVSRARPVEIGPEFEAYRASYAMGHPASSVKVLDRATRNFRDFAGESGLATMQSVGIAHCRGFLERRTAQGKAFRTVAVEMRMLAAIWSRAKGEGRIADNPWESVSPPGKAPDAPPKFWTVEELGKVLDATHGYLRDLILLGVNCGGRITSMLHLSWKDVDFGREFLSLDSKTGRYQVPMSAVALKALRRRREQSRNDWVFPSSWTDRPVRMNTTYERIRRAARKAGIPDDKKSYNHILRHTFASHAIMRGVPLATVSKWLGHASINQTMVYSHLCEHESKRSMDGFSLGDPTA